MGEIEHAKCLKRCFIGKQLNLGISTQVVNEFIAVMTKKVKNPLSIDEVEKVVARFKENFEIGNSVF